ncbi:MAG: DUF2238 domain-containing protein, partial [Spirochaetales bacterium]
MVMEILLVSGIFIVGYVLITLESRTGVNKAAVSILMAFLCWIVVLAEHIGRDQSALAQLDTSLVGIAQIVFFLLGAMAIVETIDAHNGFLVISRLLRTGNRQLLLWLVAGLTFLMSSVLDNVTTTIVMVTLLRKVLPDRQDRFTFAGMIVIAANAGGAWTPIGDVTTSMLWIGGQVSALGLIAKVGLPSIVALVIPLVWVSRGLRSAQPAAPCPGALETTATPGSGVVLGIGLGALLLTPVLKATIDLPPYIGTLAGLSVLWAYTDLFRPDEERYQVPTVLRRIDQASLFFFIGILLAVGALESTGILARLATAAVQAFRSPEYTMPLFGIVSALVDNVPLTATAMGMFDLTLYPTDAPLWLLAAFCVGTGGSMLIIGSAVLVWSAIEPYDRFVWFLEVFPAIAAAILLWATYRRFRLSTLAYVLILIHAVILMVGGHWTYARVPWFNWLRDTFDLARNYYDRVGHFAQGFIPAIVAREILLRTSPLRPGKWLAVIVVAMCLAISAGYELLEWGVAVTTDGSATDFRATQGDEWDTQWDMCLAAFGA